MQDGSLQAFFVSPHYMSYYVVLAIARRLKYHLIAEAAVDSVDGAVRFRDPCNKFLKIFFEEL